MNVEKIIEQVKYNCNISDARAWGYYSICGLLMRMRELYRHEHALKPWQPLPNGEILKWIGRREALWADLGDGDFRGIDICGESYGPFDNGPINAVANNYSYVYGGGYGLFHRPTFFFALLREKRAVGEFTVFYAEDELCRDLSASMAMLQGKNIYIRLEPFRSFLLDKFIELRGRKFGGALEYAFSSYMISKDESPSEALYNKIKNLSLEAVDILAGHEIAEAVENEGFEPWLDILHHNNDKFVELYVRGIKDVLSDTSASGPLKLIIEKRSDRLMGFFMVMLDGIRKELFPEILTAFQRFLDTGDWAYIEEAREAGHKKAKGLRENILHLWKKKKSIEDIKRYIKAFRNREHGDSA